MWKRILVCVLVCLLILAIAFCPTRRYSVTDPTLGALEAELRAAFPNATGLRVSILRPTLFWDVTLSSETSEFSEDAVFAYLVKLIHKHNIYEVIQEKEFLFPTYHWADTMQINIRVMNIFSKIHKQFISHYTLQEPGRTNEIDNFTTWYLVRDIHRADGETIKELVTPESSGDDSLDALVSDAIIEHFKPSFLRGVYQTFVTEYHETIETVVEGETVTVYIVTLYAQYQPAGDEIALTGAVCTPAAVTFTKTESGYDVTEFWEAENGVRFESSIRKKFPPNVAEATLDLMSHGLVDAMEICDERARAFFSAP